MYPLTCRTTTFLLASALLPIMQSSFAAPPEGCTPIDSKLSSGQSKILIHQPGHYCLTEDLHARFEMADHPAEAMMILIIASDVVLDLQGHTLGRGWLFKNPGGVGILINDATNIHIRNGVLQDFKTAILRGTKVALSSNKEEPALYDAQTNTYRFPISNIVVENVTFKNNKKDLVILLKKDSTP